MQRVSSYDTKISVDIVKIEKETLLGEEAVQSVIELESLASRLGYRIRNCKVFVVVCRARKSYRNKEHQ